MNRYRTSARVVFGVVFLGGALVHAYFASFSPQSTRSEKVMIVARIGERSYSFGWGMVPPSGCSGRGSVRRGRSRGDRAPQGPGSRWRGCAAAAPGRRRAGIGRRGPVRPV